MDSVSAFVYDKYETWDGVNIDRINREFIIIRQFRPPLRFGASELTTKTTPKDTLGYWLEIGRY